MNLKKYFTIKTNFVKNYQSWIHIKIRNRIRSKLGQISGSGHKYNVPVFKFIKLFLTFLTCKQRLLCSKQTCFRCSCSRSCFLKKKRKIYLQSQFCGAGAARFKAALAPVPEPIFWSVDAESRSRLLMDLLGKQKRKVLLL